MSQVITKQTITRTLGTFKDAAVAAFTALGTAEEQVSQARVACGRVLSEMSVALLAKGANGEQVQASLVERVNEWTGRTLAWDTLNKWIAAADVESTLPEDLHGRFSIDALGTLRSLPVAVPDGKSHRSRADFASAVPEGTSDAKLRGLVRVEKGLPEVPEKKVQSPADKAKKLQSDEVLIAQADKVRAILVDEGVTMSEEQVMVIITLGTMLGAKQSDQKACRIAADHLIFFTPEGEQS